MPRIEVLDKGYVQLLDVMGSDLSIVNAAKSSFQRRATTMGPAEERLLLSLARRLETSPFRHCFMTFEVYAPLMVARQWWKYVVGSDHTMDAWNETSRRYFTEENQFYVPADAEWREAPATRRQGSGPGYLPSETADKLTDSLARYQTLGLELYQAALEDGAAIEQARLFLAAYGLYIRWTWSASLNAVCWFIAQRTEEAAQSEIRDYAIAMRSMIVDRFPVATEALIHHMQHGRE